VRTLESLRIEVEDALVRAGYTRAEAQSVVEELLTAHDNDDIGPIG
jgi:Holliday junction resolvasome RuvABC DNA-binding subunit